MKSVVNSRSEMGGIWMSWSPLGVLSRRGGEEDGLEELVKMDFRVAKGLMDGVGEMEMEMKREVVLKRVLRGGGSGGRGQSELQMAMALGSDECVERAKRRH